MPAPKSASDTRSEQIMLRVTPAEKDAIQARAEADRRTIAEWCYLVVTDEAKRKAKA